MVLVGYYVQKKPQVIHDWMDRSAHDMCERDFRKEYKCRTEWVRGERWKFGRFENGQDREAHDTVAFWTFDTLEVRKMSVTTKKLKEYPYKCQWVMVRGLCRGRIFCSHVGSVEKIMSQ